MAESGEYDQTTLLRRQKIAEAMFADAMKPRQIEHWTQGLAQISQAGVGMLLSHKADKEAKTAREQDRAALMSLLGGGVAASPPNVSRETPPAPAMPMAAPASPPDFGGAISGIESGGRHDAMGPVTRTGDRAYGKYQVMGANLPTWTKEHLGRELTPEQFLADKDAQEAVFKGQFGKYVQQTGNPQDAASMWFTGLPLAQGASRRDQLGTTGQSYVDKFTKALGPQGGMGAVAQAMTPSVMGAGGAPAKPDAQGVYGPDATMLPDTQPMAFSGAPAPSPAPGGQQAVAQAMTPQAAPAPAAGPQGGLLAGLPANQRAAVIAGMSAREGSPARALATSILTNSIKGAEKTNDIKEYERAVSQGYKGGLLEYQKELKTAATEKTGDITEYEFAKKQGFSGTLQDWIQRKRAGAGEYGMQPIWGVGQDGAPAVMQLGKSGDAIQSKVPEGFKIAKDPIRIDSGTGTILLDPQTRQQIGFIPKDVAGAAKQKEIGEAEGQATAALPGTVSKAEMALKTIDQIRKHPGRDSMFGVGKLGWVPGLPGTDQKGFVSLVDQAKGQTFLQAFESLKGGGAITETEGLKATQAIARIDRAQNDKDFNLALKDLEDVIKSGVDRARQRAGGTGAAPAAAAPDPLGIR